MGEVFASPYFYSYQLLKMKSSKVFNNISAKLKAEIPKLKPGERVVFQMLNGVPNPEPDDKERAKSPILYGKMQVQTNMRIYDPYQKDDEGKEVGGYVDIGCVDVWDGEKPVTFRFLVPGQGHFSQFQGKFELVGGNVKDEELYEILWLSNQREGNPHKDPSVEPLFKILDLKQDSKKSVSKVDMLREALDIVKNATTAEMKKVMAALNQPTYQDDEVLKAKFGELARDNYEQFLQVWKDPSTDTKAVIKEALDKNVITHDFKSGDLMMGKIKLGALIVDSVGDLPAEITKWLKTSDNGTSVLANIKNQLVPKVTASK